MRKGPILAGLRDRVLIGIHGVHLRSHRPVSTFAC